MTLPSAPRPDGGRLIDARLSLLDRQVLDVNGEPVGVVDDLEVTDLQIEPLQVPEPLVEVRLDPIRVLNLVHGPIVLERIVGGRRPSAHFERVPWDAVARLGSAVELAIPGDAVPVGWLEGWLARNVIARIPGGRHVPR